MEHHCWFTASEPDTELIGGVYPEDASTKATPLRRVAVRGSTSTEKFDLSSGDYRYEFNITSGSEFTLKLFVDGVLTDISPADFDPNDPDLGEFARIGRKASFTIS